MAQAGYTPIQLYYSTTTTNAPSAGNLTDGELAINTADGKLFYKDNLGAVQVIAWKTTPTTAGGTGLTSWTAGDLPYYATGTTLTKLGIGSAGQILTSTGTAPQWSTLSGVAVTTFSAGTTGFTPNTPTSGAITLGGTLATTNGGTGLTSFTANRVFYASSTSAVGQSANLTFDGTTLTANALTTTSTVTINGGTANGVAYLNGSKVLTTGSALTFDGTNLGIGTSSPGTPLDVVGTVRSSANVGGNASVHALASTGGASLIAQTNSRYWRWLTTNSDTTFRLVDETAAATRLTVDTSGNLGIGTSSPTRTLTVSSASPIPAQIESSGTDSRISIVTSTGSAGSGFIQASSGALLLGSSNAERMRISSAGDVGIGTSSPGARVDVRGASTDIGVRYIETSTGNTNRIELGAFAGSGYVNATAGVGQASLALQVNSSTRATIDSSGNLGLGVTPSAWGGTKALEVSVLGSAMIAFSANNTQFLSNAYFNGTNWIYANNGAANRHQFNGGAYFWDNAASGTAGGTVTWTERMRLDSSGNLGIGTSSPASKLDVYSTGNTTLTISGSSGSGGDVSQIDFFRIGSNVTSSIKAIRDGSNTSGALTFYTATLGTNAEKMRLDSSGNLGIGTSSPNYRLSVQGAVEIRSASALHLRDSGNTNFASVFNSSGAMVFETSFAERARITSGGNVSIGGTADRGTTVGSAALQLFNGTAPAGTLTNGVSLYSQSGDLRFMDAAGNAYQVGFRNVPRSGSAKTTSYTLATTDVGEYIEVGSGGSITIPDATFATGDVVSIFNNTSGNITITCTITTAYIAGTDSDKATMTLATRGVATILFISGTVCVVSGNVT